MCSPLSRMPFSAIRRNALITCGAIVLVDDYYFVTRGRSIATPHVAP